MKKYLALVLFLSACSHKPALTETPPTEAPRAPAAETTAHDANPNTESAAVVQLREKGFELLYSRDEGTRDPKKALTFFQQAAELNDPVSLDILGGYYSTGLGGVEKSCKNAMEAYSKAALLGYPLSANNLAYTLVTCPDPKMRDPQRAEKLIQGLFQQSPFFLAMLDTYAAALARLQQTKKAAEVQKTVVQLADFMEVEPERMKQLKRSLAAYEKGKEPLSSFRENN